MALSSFKILLCAAVVSLFLEPTRCQEQLECKKGWVNHNNACYYFSSGTYARKTSNQAHESCRSYYSSLAVIEDQTELDWVAQELQKKDNQDNNMLARWIDISADESTKFTVPFANEPDNANGKKKCVVINQEGYFRNENCSRKAIGVCKTTNSTICKESRTKRPFDTNSNTCYFKSDSDATWELTRKYCQDRGGDLVSIDKATEISDVRSVLHQMAYLADWWTGLHFNDETGQYVFTDNTPYNKDAVPWLTKQVLSGKNTETCTALLSGGKLTKNRCKSLGRYICKHPLVKRSETECPVNWQKQGGSCYYFSVPYSVNWTQAESECKSMGAQLLKIHDKDERDRLKYSIVFYAFFAQWTGLNYQSEKGAYVWDDGTQYDKALVNFDQSHSNENTCIVIRAYGFFSQVPCTAIYPFICEKEVNTNAGENLGK